MIHQRFQNASSLGPRGDALSVFDWCVGRVVEELKKRGIYKDTIMIISSDNGPVLFDGYWEGAIEKNGDHNAGGPWRGGKYSRWEGGTRMPFIVSWPGKIKPGISNALVTQTDFFASFAALIGQEVPKGAAPDSVNVLPALLGEVRNWT